MVTPLTGRKRTEPQRRGGHRGKSQGFQVFPLCPPRLCGSVLFVDRQGYRPSLLRREVDGPDDLDRLAPLAAVDGGGAPLVDGLEEVGELVAVAGVVDAAGVA